MATWDIDPAGVQAVLNSVQAETASLDAFGPRLDGELTGAVTESSSALVGSAVGGLLEGMMPQVQMVFTRVGSAITGAYNATSSYVTGDLEMAATAQAAATAAPSAVPMPGVAGVPQ